MPSTRDTRHLITLPGDDSVQSYKKKNNNIIINLDANDVNFALFMIFITYLFNNKYHK